MQKAVPAVFMICLIMLFASGLRAQHRHAVETPTMKEMDNTTTAMSSRSSIQAQGHDHEHGMGAHMRMTTLRAPQPGDKELAQQIVETARKRAVDSTAPVEEREVAVRLLADAPTLGPSWPSSFGAEGTSLPR